MMVAVGTNSCSSSSRFGASSTSQPGHAREVAARPVQAGDKSSLDRVDAVWKTIGIVVVAAFAAGAAGVPDRDNHGHLTANQIGRQCRQSVVLILRPAIFDRYVLAFDIAGFSQALAERGQDVADCPGALVLRKPITGIAGCCARAASGHAAAPPRSVMNSRRLIRSPRRRARAALAES